MRLALFASPALALGLLELARTRYDLAAVWSRPPRRAARGHRLLETPIAAAARTHGIATFMPERLSGADAERLTSLNVDAVLVFAYGARLPTEVLATPHLGCFNLHLSLLPRWRGASPVAAALLAGDQTTGWTWFRMEAAFDAGAILARGSLAIGEREDAPALEARLGAAGTAALPQLLEDLEKGTAEACLQDEAQASFSPRLTRADGVLDWRQPAPVLARRVRALAPWPGCHAELGDGDARLKVLQARAGTGESAHAALAVGSVLASPDSLAVVCGAGILILEQVQRAGRASVSGAAFARGAALPKILPLPEEA